MKKAFLTFIIFVVIDVLFLSINKDTKSFLNDTIKYEFIFGASLFLIYAGSFKEKLAGLALIVVSAFAAKFLSTSIMVRAIEFGLPALLFCGVLISIEQLFLKYKRKIQLPLFLGEISYSLYLIHPFVIQTVAIFAKKVIFLQNTLLFYTVVIVISIIASNVFYHIIEKNLTMKIKTLSASRFGLKSKEN